MRAKKRRTVTTIETHESWIVRRVVQDDAEEAEIDRPIEIPQAVSVSALGETDESSQTNGHES